MNCLGDELSEYMNRGRVVKEASYRGLVVGGRQLPVVKG